MERRFADLGEVGQNRAIVLAAGRGDGEDAFDEPGAGLAAGALRLVPPEHAFAHPSLGLVVHGFDAFVSSEGRQASPSASGGLRGSSPVDPLIIRPCGGAGRIVTANRKMVEGTRQDRPSGAIVSPDADGRDPVNGYHPVNGYLRFRFEARLEPTTESSRRKHMSPPPSLPSS